eukprot:UN33203
MADYFAFESDEDNKDHPLGGDNFLVRKNQIETQRDELTSTFDRWRNLLDKTNTASSNTFNTLTQRLKKDIKSISKNIKELNVFIDVYKTNPKKFSYLTDDEISRRTFYVEDLSKQIKYFKGVITSPKTRETVERHKEELLMKKQNHHRNQFEREEQRENEGILTAYRSEQQLQVKQQDEILDDMLGSLQRLGAMGGQIQVEIEEQNEMLEDIEDDIDDAQD